MRCWSMPRMKTLSPSIGTTDLSPSSVSRECYFCWWRRRRRRCCRAMLTGPRWQPQRGGIEALHCASIGRETRFLRRPYIVAIYLKRETVLGCNVCEPDAFLARLQTDVHAMLKRGADLQGRTSMR